MNIRGYYVGRSFYGWGYSGGVFFWFFFVSCGFDYWVCLFLELDLVMVKLVGKWCV